jgi:demethylmenaquinone methyltransferase/2-methoxy-6-polyprenyl-1,4-benzoquinol methylase
MVAAAMTQDSMDSAGFGYRRVTAEEKQDLVNEIFAKVADRYDEMNDLMSGGLHRLWKDDFVTLLAPPRGARPFHVLDVAGGTGDIAFRIVRSGGPATRVTIADISPAMIDIGAKRADTEGLARFCRFTIANAEALPFADRSFDAYTIAFGIRNVSSSTAASSSASNSPMSTCRASLPSITPTR